MYSRHILRQDEEHVHQDEEEVQLRGMDGIALMFTLITQPR